MCLPMLCILSLESFMCTRAWYFAYNLSCCEPFDTHSMTQIRHPWFTYNLRCCRVIAVQCIFKSLRTTPKVRHLFEILAWSWLYLFCPCSRPLCSLYPASVVPCRFSQIFPTMIVFTDLLMSINQNMAFHNSLIRLLHLRSI